MSSFPTVKSSYLRHIIPSLAILTLIGMVGCSTQKNTAGSRWWHSFNAQYNTYYNATLAYVDASLEKEIGNKDNFTELIPLYTIGNKNSRELGKGNYDIAITKCEKAIQQHSIKKRPAWDKNRRKTARDIEWLSRKEYNPFLWKAWLLMGRSQFYKGDFESAASTFSYMSRLYATQPAIYGKARAWLAKCYIEDGWIYDAEDVIRNIQRDSIHWRAQKEWDYTFADYYIHIRDYKKAIPFLQKVISHEMRRKQKAREWYLMGQLQAAIGNKDLSFKAFKRVIRLNPPYEIEFNARIAMTEVLAKDASKQSLGKLRRMAKSDKNKEYLDQVYYAMGNIFLSQKDTIRAIQAYEKGTVKATRNGIEKGVLWLHLGNLYWNTESYSNAQHCYGEAIGLLDKDRKDYEELSMRSKILDELVPYTNAIQLQDSLQILAQMSEEERNAAIDKIIAIQKKKEKEQKYTEAETTQADNGGSKALPQMPTSNNTNLANQNGAQNNALWYFYNPIAVSQGKTQFQRLWGKIDNVDNWQRSNKTVVSSAQKQDEEKEMDEIPSNSSNSKSASTTSKVLDPHQRAYYLAQIPLTAEQKEASDKLIQDGLLHAGIIFKDQLNNLKLSEKYLKRLTDNYPSCKHLNDAYYHLYLLYGRQNQEEKATSCLETLKARFPQSPYTALLSDPYYKENARLGTHIEDSLYTATYEAFKAGRYQEVLNNCKISTTRFTQGANRDKFLFIAGLTKLYQGNISECLSDLRTIIQQYPTGRISEIAGMIINGINQGRQIHAEKFDLKDIWTRRSTVLSDKPSHKIQAFSDERMDKYIFMYVYEPDSINENQLLFEVAKYNFTTYLVRNFDIKIEAISGLHRLMVTGFRNYEEAWQYAHAINQEANIKKQASRAHVFIISEPNISLLGTSLSYKDYEDFYNKHYKSINPRNASVAKEKLNEPEEIVIQEKNEKTETPILEENKTQQEDTGIYFDDGFGKESSEGNEDEYIELNGF